jgi:hypothetical protein
MKMKIYDKIIIDSDICMKLGNFTRVPDALYNIIQGITNSAYVHEYVYKEEMIIKIEQLERLIEEGFVRIINPKVDFSLPLQETMYTESLEILFDEIVGIKLPSYPRGEHYGEVYSLAAAKALGIPIFMSDESSLNQVIKRVLNTGIDDISVARLKDIILWIHDNGFSRSDAKAIYIGNSSKEYMEANKKWFAQNWPAEK